MSDFRFKLMDDVVKGAEVIDLHAELVRIFGDDSEWYTDDVWKVLVVWVDRGVSGWALRDHYKEVEYWAQIVYGETEGDIWEVGYQLFPRLTVTGFRM